LNVTEFSDKRSRARNKVGDFSVLSRQTKAGLTLVLGRNSEICNEFRHCEPISTMGAQSTNDITQTTVKVGDLGTVDCAITFYNRLIGLPDWNRVRQHHQRNGSTPTA
jgi:hypothetical protein